MDEDYTKYGFSKYLTNTITGDKSYQTASDYDAKVQDGAVSNSKIKSLIADKISAGTIDASKVNVTNIDADNIASGTIDASIINVINLVADYITSGKLQSSDTKTYFDLDNDVLVVNDGTYDRVLIGKLS